VTAQYREFVARKTDAAGTLAPLEEAIREREEG
jgi:hypothetical protein